MTPQDLAKQLTAGRIEPLYLIVGEETWLVDEALAALRRFASPADNLIDTHVVSGSETDPAELVAIAQTLPAAAPRRFILVRDADRLAASDALTAYCDDPSPSTCLAFVMAKLDRRKPWVQALVNRAATVTCDPLKPAGMRAWLLREASARSVALAEDAVAYLLARSEGSLRTLAQHLEQLALSRTGSPGRAGVQDLGAIAPGHATVSVFDWAHAVAMGRLDDALAHAHRLLRDEPPLLMLSILAGQWRKMIRYRALLDGGAAPGQAVRALELPPFAANRVAEAAQRHSLPELVAGLTWCLETDAALKGGSMAAGFAVDRLVTVLCGRLSAPVGRSVTGAWWTGWSARREAVGVAGQARDQT